MKSDVLNSWGLEGVNPYRFLCVWAVSILGAMRLVSCPSWGLPLSDYPVPMCLMSKRVRECPKCRHSTAD